MRQSRADAQTTPLSTVPKVAPSITKEQYPLVFEDALKEVFLKLPFPIQITRTKVGYTWQFQYKRRALTRTLEGEAETFELAVKHSLTKFMQVVIPICVQNDNLSRLAPSLES
jgi:hypothetical protein